MSGDGSSRRFDVVAETRRRWSLAEKRAIVAQACGAGMNVSALARRHGIKPSLLFRWKKDLAGTGPTRPAASLVPVVISSSAAEGSNDGMAQKLAPAATVVEIELVGGRRIRVSPEIEAAALKRIIAAVES